MKKLTIEHIPYKAQKARVFEHHAEDIKTTSLGYSAPAIRIDGYEQGKVVWTYVFPTNRLVFYSIADSVEE